MEVGYLILDSSVMKTLFTYSRHHLECTGSISALFISLWTWNFAAATQNLDGGKKKKKCDHAQCVQ